MRISEKSKQDMQKRILSDLYDVASDALKKRRDAIIIQNRDYFLEPYLAILEKLPKELVSYTREAMLTIKYRLNPELESFDINQNWSYQFDEPKINMVDLKYSYGSRIAIPMILDQRLRVETAKLCNDMIALKKEKDDLTAFLDQTLKEWSGPNQLRTVWPESLHKYLPTIAAKTTKATRTAANKPTAVAAPMSLNTRLTTNLLEGN